MRVALLFFAALLSISDLGSAAAKTPGQDDKGAAYRVDLSWPKLPLPHEWLIGDVGGVSVDRHDHIWIVHRPGTLAPIDILAGAKCCVAAPPVIEFDTDGKVLRAWGGPKQVKDWFDSEHSIFIDDDDNVWIVGAGTHDGELLKFTMDGKPLLRVGRKGDFVAADDPSMLGMPTDIYVDTKQHEVFVSDGYRNHRVIVFDSDTGAFKRQWTAYGKKVDPAAFTSAKDPDFAAQGHDPEHFTTVHCVTMIGGELYVCDRANDRIQVFTPEGKYLREIYFNRGQAGTVGSAWDVAPLPGQPDNLVVIDGTNSEIGVLDRHSGAVIRRYRSKGRYAGQMHWPHQLAVDEQGRLYITEVGSGARIQRFVPTSEEAR